MTTSQGSHGRSSPRERLAAGLVASVGILIVGIGLHFLLIRSAMLPEDTRFTGVTPGELPARFSEWLGRFLWSNFAIRSDYPLFIGVVRARSTRSQGTDPRISSPVTEARVSRPAAETASLASHAEEDASRTLSARNGSHGLKGRKIDVPAYHVQRLRQALVRRLRSSCGERPRGRADG